MRNTEPEEGNIYIVYEKEPDISMRILRKKVQEGCKGLIISRTHPHRLRKKSELDIPHIWLARDNTNEFVQSVHPEHLMKINTILSSFINSTTKDKIILLDGLEYLIGQNDFETIMRFIQLVNELVNTSNTCILVPIHPAALTERQKGLLEREVMVLSAEEDGDRLNDWLMEQKR